MDFSRRYKPKHYPNAMDTELKCGCGRIFKYKDISSLEYQDLYMKFGFCDRCIRIYLTSISNNTNFANSVSINNIYSKRVANTNNSKNTEENNTNNNEI